MIEKACGGVGLNDKAATDPSYLKEYSGRALSTIIPGLGHMARRGRFAKRGCRWIVGLSVLTRPCRKSRATMHSDLRCTTP